MLFEAELKRLGLKDKEAAVYLACLQLGPSPVQRVARKAKVVRATTYVVLESLMKQGLVTKYKEGKKTLFSAEPPRQLMRLVEKEEEAVSDKKSELEGLLPELQILMRGAGDQPSVRYFEGREGLHAIRQEIVMECQAGDMVYNFTPSDHLNAVFPETETSYYRQRAAKGIKSKTLFASRSAQLVEKMLSVKEYAKLSERRYIPPEYFPAASGMSIFHDKIAIGSFTGKLGGVIIESKSMADMMRNLFELAWAGAKTIDGNKSLRAVSDRLDK